MFYVVSIFHYFLLARLVIAYPTCKCLYVIIHCCCGLNHSDQSDHEKAPIGEVEEQPWSVTTYGPRQDQPDQEIDSHN